MLMPEHRAQIEQQITAIEEHLVVTEASLNAVIKILEAHMMSVREARKAMREIRHVLGVPKSEEDSLPV